MGGATGRLPVAQGVNLGFWGFVAFMIAIVGPVAGVVYGAQDERVEVNDFFPLTFVTVGIALVVFVFAFVAWLRS